MGIDHIFQLMVIRMIARLAVALLGWSTIAISAEGQKSTRGAGAISASALYEQGRRYLTIKATGLKYYRCDGPGPNRPTARRFGAPYGSKRGNELLAIEKFDAAIVRDPGHAPAHAYRGLAYYSIGKPKMAVLNVDRAFALDRDNPIVLTSRSTIYVAIGRAGAALNGIRRATALDPNNVEARIALGNAYLALGRHRQAANTFLYAVRIDPMNARAKAGLSNALLKQGDRAGAMRYAEGALRLDSKCVDCLIARAAVHLAVRQHTKAVADYRAAIDADHCDMQAYAELARIGATPGRAHDSIHCIVPPTIDLSIAACRREIDYFASRPVVDTNAIYNRGLHYIELGKFRLAIRDFNNAMSANRSNLRYYQKQSGVTDPDVNAAMKGMTGILLSARGEAYRGLKKPNLAMADFNKAINFEEFTRVTGGLFSSKLRAYTGRGLIHLSNRNYEQAIRDLSVTIKLTVLRVDAIYGRATAYLAVGRKVEAVADFRKVLELSPDHRAARAALRRLGDKK